MFSLKDHPFGVEAFFNTSLVLTYAVPKREIIHLLPPCLEPDLFHDEWAFMAIAMVDTKQLRPKGFPAWAGNDFILIGCRLFVRYTTREGKRLRGLYILKSETNKQQMAFFGNLFTHYRYTTTDIAFHRNESMISVHSRHSGIDVNVTINQPDIPLPPSSPFTDWKEARRFAGPLPFTFTYNAVTKEVLIIEGVRENWTPRPATVNKAHIDFVAQQHLKGVVLANAFYIEHIPYYWKKGRKEIWQG